MGIERVLLASLLIGCGYRPAAFTDAPPVLDARDEAPIAMPEERSGLKALYWTEAYIERGVIDTLEVREPPLARDVNRLDEVVRSSWFRGNADDYAPDGPPKPPFSARKDGRIDIEPSLTIRDARGLAYQLVFDAPGQPETRTAAMAIASRLVHALGYRTAETHVIVTPSGQRAAAMRWPVGRDLGPTPMLWTRPDDPNDVLRHEDRRTLRVTRVIAAWLGIRRFPEQMFRDVYVGASGRGFVRHYIVGFEGALGTDLLLDSMADAFDPTRDDTPGRLLLPTLGFYPMSEDIPPTSTGITGVGLYPASVDLDEEVIKPPFAPHDRMRADDGYWIAKRLARLDERTLDEAIEAGRLTEWRARRYVRSAIELRRREVVRALYQRVTPVDVVEVRRGMLKLIDREGGKQRYRVEVTDPSGERMGLPRILTARSARFGIPVAVDPIVVRIFKGDRTRSLDVHLKRGLLGVEH